MSPKSSRKRKQTPPRKNSQSAKGARAGVGGQPTARPAASGAGPSAAAESPGSTGSGSGAPPLQAFRAPAVKPPARAIPSSRLSVPVGPPRGRQPGGGSGAPATPARPPATGATPPSRPAGKGQGRVVAVATPEPPDGTLEVQRPPVLARDMPAGPVQVMSWTCSALDGVDPQGLGLTYWFDAAPSGEPYPVSVRFSGRRVSGDGPPGSPDSFETIRTIERVIPGSGRVALTARVPQVATGTWEVTATPVVSRRPDGSLPPAPPGRLLRGSATGTTSYFPIVNVRAPGVRLGAWPALVGLGWVLALVLQWVLGTQRGLPVGRMLAVSLVASIVGLVGAKTYYLLTHRDEKPNPLTAGMSVQGFVLAAVAVLVLGGWLAGIPLGPMLDVTAPGLLYGMTIGRLGCFFGGCCVGLPTASRWGIWSSDRGLGVRRIPVQLFESSMAAIVATATLLAVVFLDPPVGGLLFIAGLAAYTFGRQVLFPLRGIPRSTLYGRQVMMVVTALALAGVVLTVILT